MEKDKADDYLASGGLVCPDCEARFPAWGMRSYGTDNGSTVFACLCNECHCGWTEHIGPDHKIEVRRVLEK